MNDQDPPPLADPGSGAPPSSATPCARPAPKRPRAHELARLAARLRPYGRCRPRGAAAPPSVLSGALIGAALGVLVAGAGLFWDARREPSAPPPPPVAVVAAPRLPPAPPAADAPPPTVEAAPAPGRSRALSRRLRRARGTRRLGLRRREIAPAEPGAAGGGPGAAATGGPAGGAGPIGRDDSVGEVDLIGRARESLGPSPAEALALTGEHARRFPRGVLVQEREVLAIEALRGLGRTDEARARKDRFLSAYPGSAHRPRLEALFGTLRRFSQKAARSTAPPPATPCGTDLLPLRRVHGPLRRHRLHATSSGVGSDGPGRGHSPPPRAPPPPSGSSGATLGVEAGSVSLLAGAQWGQDGHDGYDTVTTGFRDAPDGTNGLYTTSNIGPCTIRVVVTEPINGTATYRNAGPVTVSGGSVPISLTPMTPDASSGTDYNAIFGFTSSLFSGGESFTFAATGAEVPAFTATVVAPSTIDLQSPVVPSDGMPFALDRSADLDFAWSSGGFGDRRRLLRGLDGHHRGCTFPSSSGTGTIPTAALAAPCREVGGPSRSAAKHRGASRRSAAGRSHVSALRARST